MPKKKSRKTTQSQSQSQKVIVNIGTATARKRKRKGRGGAGPGGGGGYYHNLAPTIINSPQVDYTPLLAMMQYQTRTLQTEGIKNPETPLSSTVANAEQMAGQAAIARSQEVRSELDDDSSTASSKFLNRERQEMEREAMEKEDISSRAQPKESTKGLSLGRKQRRPGRTSDTFQPSSELDRRVETEEAVEPFDTDTPVAEGKGDYQKQEREKVFGGGEATKRIELNDPQYKRATLVLAQPTGAQAPAVLPKDEEMGYSAGPPVPATTKKGPKFKDESKLAQGEPVDDVIAIRQGELKPGQLSNQTGLLENQTPLYGTPSSTPRPVLIRQQGLLGPDEYKMYKYLERKIQKGEELSEMRQNQSQILRKRLQEYGVVKPKN